jgi:hypothetical protein
MSDDPFDFGPPPGHRPGQPPGMPPPGPFGGGGGPFGGPVQPNPGGPPQHGLGAAGFGVPGTPAGPTVAHPPTWLLFLAVGLALVAGIVALVLDSPVVAIVCWVVAGPVAIGLLALFVVKDTFARASEVYSALDWVKPLHYGAIVLCLLCILVPALRIADWVGRL